MKKTLFGLAAVAACTLFGAEPAATAFITVHTGAALGPVKARREVGYPRYETRAAAK